MSVNSNITKSNWNDSMHIFFSPKLSLEGKKMFPQLVGESSIYQKQPNFLSVFKKPIVNMYDKAVTKCQRKEEKKKYVQVIGENKNVQNRIKTTNAQKRCLSPKFDEELVRNYQETLTHAVNIHQSSPKKRMSYNKITQKAGDQSHKKQAPQLYYYIGPGNNSNLIHQILSRRLKWGETNNSLFNFRWEQTRPKYQNSPITKQIYNHLPNHQIISDKVRLINCLKSYCEKNEEFMFKIIPVCFEFNFGDLERCQDQIKRFVQFYWEIYDKSTIKMEMEDETCSSPEAKTIKYESPKKNSKKESSQPKNKNFRTYKKESYGQILNPQLSKKKQEIKLLHKSLLAKLKAHHVFIDMATLKKQNAYITPLNFQVYGNTSLWLLKPSDLNRGRGIHLFRTIDELGDLLKSELGKHQKGSFIVQKYIERPMLIDSRKFDIRVFGLVTQNQQFYFFSEGYIRTSSYKFDINCKNYYTHLTNNAIQKNSQTYGQFEEGNILPLHYLFKNCGVNRATLFQEIKRKIKITFKASRSKLFSISEKKTSTPIIHHHGSSSPNTKNNQNRVKHFQIFGYDFMLDQNKDTWLIEVNTNPCIELSNVWLKSIIPRMLDDAFKLTIDQMFPKGQEVKKPSNFLKTHRQQCESLNKDSEQIETVGEIKEQKSKNYRYKQYFSVPGYPDAENMWELLDLTEQKQTILTYRVSASQQI